MIFLCLLFTGCFTTYSLLCVFPFAYNGVTYEGCTDVESSGYPWCATSLMEDSLEYKEFGYCGPDCPQDIGNGKKKS